MENFKKKTILLIAPYGNIPNYWLPLSLGYLKSNIPENKYEVKILDCTFEDMPSVSIKFLEKIKELKPYAVGITTMSPTYLESLSALKIVKSVDNNIITIMGGSHPSVYPDEVMKNEFVDYVFRGEAELSFPLFLNESQNIIPDFSTIKGLVYRRNNQIIKNEINTDPDLDKIKIPDYHAIRLNEYLDRGYKYGGFFMRNAPLWLTRGCPYNCSFCSARLLNGRIIRYHSVSYVIKWITYLYEEFNIRQFNIIDDNFTFNLDYAKNFCCEIIKLKENKFFKEKIYFSTPNGIRMQRVDDELLHLMKKAGWTDITVAPESGSLKTLKRMRKGITPDIVPDIVKRIKKVGFIVRGFFIIGYPGESRDDIKDTVKSIRKCNFDFFILGRFFPIPGTPVFQELIETGEIKPDYIPDYNYSIMMPTKNDKIYTPPGLKNFNFFALIMREYFLLFLRNPKSILWIIKSYGVSRILKILFFVRKRKK